MKQLRYAVSGQTLSHTPLVRVASADWVLEDLWFSIGSSQRTLASGTGVVPASLSVTTDAAVGPSQANARRIPVASTTGLAVGGTYSVVAPSGEWELFEVVGVVTNDYVTAKLPVIGAYPTGSTILAHALTTDVIPLNAVNDEGRLQRDEPLRIVWTYGDGQVVQEQVRLVRHTTGEHDLSRVVADVPRVFADVGTQVEHHGRSILPDQAVLALEQLRALMLTKGMKDEQVLLGEQGHWALVWRVVRNLAKTGVHPQNVPVEVWIEHADNEFASAWDHLTIGTTGKGTVELDQATDTATATEGYTYRTIFQAG